MKLKLILSAALMAGVICASAATQPVEPAAAVHASGYSICIAFMPTTYA